MKSAALFSLILALILYHFNPTVGDFRTQLRLEPALHINAQLAGIVIARTNTLYLGILGKWNKLYRIRKCNNGFQLGGSHCHCFPSWRGSFCQIPIPGAQNIYKSWIYPYIYPLAAYLNILGPLAIYDRSEAILGVPSWILPVQLVDWGRWLKLDNIGYRFTILEVLVCIHVTMHLLALYCRYHRNISWYQGTFYALPPHTLIRFITSSHAHVYTLQWLFEIVRFFTYAPRIYVILGDTRFSIFYLVACILTSMGSVKATGIHAGLSGVNTAILLSLVGSSVTIRDISIIGAWQLISGTLNVGEWVAACILAVGANALGYV